MKTTSRRQLLMSLAAGGAGMLGIGSAWFAGQRSAGGDSEVGSLQSAGGPLLTESGQSRAFGTDISLTAMHSDRATARRAVAAALAEVDVVDRLMSLYRPQSELCRLNYRKVLDRPHPYLVAVLQHALAVARQSEGAFDVTVQPLWALYAEAARGGGRPGPRALAQAVAAVDWRRVEVGPQGIRLHGQGTAVTLNGIAQGFAADRAMEALRRHGVCHGLVNCGEIGTLGGRGPAEPWTVGIQHPRRKEAFLEMAKVRGRCLATSGDYATTFDKEYRDHHIFDPHTGRSPQALSSVSVAAHTAAEADALATALFVLGPENGLRLIKAVPAADALLVFKDGRTLATAGFPAAS